MSFKRDGDDFSALSYQRKRRVSELLQEDIAEEEVSKLRNGKFVCKLCFHKPIFDTLSMFYVHKQGKKHLASQEYHAQQKQELDDLVEKRRHEHAVNIEQSQIKEQNALKIQQKARPSQYDRRKVVDLDHQPSSDTNTPSRHSLRGNKTSEAEQGGHSSKHKEQFVKDFVAKSPQDNHMKMRFNTKEKPDTVWNKRKDQLKSDIKLKASKTSDSVSHECDDSAELVSTANVNRLINNSVAENTTKYYLARKKQKSECEKEVKATLMGKVQLATDSTGTGGLGKSWEYFKSGAVLATSTPHFANKCAKKKTNLVVSDKEVDRSKTAKAEQMLQAFGSGWRKDWTGQWVKDDNAEFDSDEEPPDI